MKAITVLLVDDHKVMRDGLQALVNDQQDMEVVGIAKNGREAVLLAIQLRPDVVSMDISMPQMNGLEATGEILHLWPDAKVLMLSTYDDEAYVDMSLCLGASGYLSKGAPELLPEAIRKVHRGEIYFSPGLLKRPSVPQLAEAS